MRIFIVGWRADDGAVTLPLPSAVILYILSYCRTKSFRISLVRTNNISDVLVQMSGRCLHDFDHGFISENEVPVNVSNCVLPVIEDSADFMIRSGLCCVVRHIIKVSHAASLDQRQESLIDLLGFRAASLKACSEVSGWTKLCEVELPHSVSNLIGILREVTCNTSIEIPADIIKLELHFDRPPLLHNDDKKKRLLLKELQQKFENDILRIAMDKQKITDGCTTEKPDPDAAKNGTSDHEDYINKRDIYGFDHDENFIDQFFAIKESYMPHGSMYYRVIRKHEKERKKFLNSKDGDVCKFGCTENRLVKWCAKCNDRERLRRKERIQQLNNSRLTSSDCVNTELTESLSKVQISETDEKFAENSDISTIEELKDYLSGLTLHDVVYEHVYAEGVGLTISDLMLCVYIYYLMETLKFKCSAIFQKLPNVKKWLKHILTLPRIQQTCQSCGMDIVALKSAIEDDTYHANMPTFTIPSSLLNVDESCNEISRSAKAKHKALKKEISRVLEKVKEQRMELVTGHHPYGDDVKLDWSSVPLAAHPRIELPEKRVGRKCEQLENLATAVKSVAKPGDVIVDFCSGAGHLGIIIAYLLPDCKVYLIENKEESLIRAKDRVKELQLTNVTCYQCNLDYFQGHFDVGVCLHACGVATDLVLQQCLDRNASFVICPCCYGNIQNTHLISYPRSQYYRNSELDDKDVIILGHAADQTEKDIDLYEQGRYCMNLVDTDRASLAIENGYNVTLCSLKPLDCTPKNNLLIGIRPTALVKGR